MKRREFITKNTAGFAALCTAGCSLMPKKKYTFTPGPAPYSFKVDTPKPQGTMPVREIGNTGIKVSQCCFGSHMRQELIPFVDERRKIIRGAYDLGINFFDVYDLDGACYQYEPMGKHLAPMINDVVISVSYNPPDGLTPEQELKRMLQLFGREYIDLIRVHRSPDDPLWETFFRWKEKGYVRAVGKGIHDLSHLDGFLDDIPLDFILFPYNFYHNIAWHGETPDDFDPLPSILRSRGISVLTMKPFAGEYLVDPFNRLAGVISGKEGPEFPQASLRYILNSGVDADSVFVGMYSLSQVYDNTGAFYNPTMTAEERELLDKVKEAADASAQSLLPTHYKFLDRWAYKGVTHRQAL